MTVVISFSSTSSFSLMQPKKKKFINSNKKYLSTKITKCLIGLLPKYKANDLKALKSLGLNITQSKIYIAVLNSGPISVGTISKITRIRREQVYINIPKLQEMGLIEKELDKPVIIRSTPITQALTKLVDIKQKALKSEIAELEIVTKAFLDRQKTNVKIKQAKPKTSRFILINSKNNISSKLEQMLTRSKLRIRILYRREQLLSLIPRFSDQLSEALRNGIELRILSDDLADHLKVLEKATKTFFPKKSNFELRFTEKAVSHCFIIDEAEILSETSLTGNLGRNPVLWTDDESLVKLAIINFNTIWSSAKVVTNNVG